MLLKSIAFVLFTAALSVSGQDQPAAGAWRPLFNGKDLDGWTPKVRGCALGENYLDTFRVEGGVIKVGYDKYTDFRNSGIMIHGQDPATMGKDQNFPVSLEVQLLGGSGTGERTTSNVCTPGTLVAINGELRKDHCISSKSKTFHGDQWVTAEVEVRGHKITHRVNGEVVLEYENPVLDENDGDARKLIKDGNKVLEGGTISLQSESHPVEFRKVEIQELQP